MKKRLFVIGIILLLAGNFFVSAITYEQMMYGDQAWHSNNEDETPGSGPQSTFDRSNYIKQAAESSEKNLNELKKNASNIKAGEDPTETITNARNKAAAADQQKKSDSSDKATNQKNSKDKKDSENSDSSGDPVRITNGIYEQNESDFSVPGFSVIRKYESDNNIVSSFGYGWVFNLDERIILGNDPAARETVKNQEEYVSALAEIIRDLENQLAQDYCVTSIYNAQAEILLKITFCNQFLHESLIIKDNLERLDSESTEYEINKTVKDLIEQNEELSESLVNTINLLMLQYAGVEENVKFIEGLKEKQEAEAAKLSEINTEGENYNQIKKRNSKVMFTGMQPFYEETGLNTITLIDSNGYPHIFYKENENWKNAEDKKYIRCEKNGECFIVFEANGIFKHFDESGFIVKICDRNSNEVNIVRDENEKIKYVATAFGEVFDFSYSGNFISKVVNRRAPEQNVVYSYNGNKLVSVKDCDGDVITMNYDENSRMTKLNKCDGSCVLFSYGEQDVTGRVFATSTTNEEGFTEHFIYDRNGKRTDYIDHDGNKTSYWFDDKHRTIRQEGADGSVVINRYDSDGNLYEKEENGNLIRYTYDQKGNKLSALYNDGSMELWTYDNFNLETSYKDRDGVFYEYIRDNKGNLIEFKKGGRTVFTQAFDSRGLVTRYIQNGGSQIVYDYVYDIYGNLIEELVADKKAKYEYDSQNRITRIKENGKLITSYKYEGRCIEQADYNGLKTVMLTNGRKDITELIYIDEKSATVHKTRVEYDKRHLPLKVFKGDGENETLVSSYFYTPEGKLSAEIVHGNESWIKKYEYKNGLISEMKQFSVSENLSNCNNLQTILNKAGEKNFVLKYEYQNLNDNRKLVSVTDGLGIRNLFEYDASGNLIKSTDGNGVARQNVMTSAGRLQRSQEINGGWYEYAYSSDGNLKSYGEKGGAFICTIYNADGSLKEQTDANGLVSRYYYDNSGRLQSVQSELRKIWYTYDAFDRITKLIIGDTPDTASAVYFEEYGYSDDGRKVTVNQGDKYKTENELDAFGNIIAQTDGNDNKKRFEYDYQNRLTAEYDGYGNKISYEYNALGKISTVVYADGTKEFYKYNYMGQLEKITDEAGTLYSADYDISGRLLKEKRRADNEKSYEYDRTGRLTAILSGGEILESYKYENDYCRLVLKDGNNHEYIYNYDGFGRLINERNRNGLEQNYSYDGDGKLQLKKDFSGSTINVSYSADRKTKAIIYSDGSKNQFVYDMTGNIIEAENQYGKIIYKYDKGGRLIYQKDAETGEEISFEYDAAGNRIKLYSSNRETIYTYGKNNELKEIFDNKQRVSVKLEYDINGREVLRKFGNGTKEKTLYDKAGRVIVKMQKSDRDELLWGEGYVYGSDGKRTATVDNLGRVTFYEYNKKGQLENVYYPGNGENRFLTSGEKAELIPLLNAMQYGLAYNLPELHSFIKETCTYDANGNRISKNTSDGKTLYSYDNENYMISSSSFGQTPVNYTYDKNGNLLTEESESKTIKYAYNAENRMIYCEVTDRAEKTYAQTSYAYDAFGRRILVQDKGECALRTLYDGFTFDEIKQSPTFENGMFTDSQNTGIRWGTTGRPTGDRYRYLDDAKTKDENRYIYLDENTYKTVNSRYRSERTAVTVNGTIAAQATSDYGAEYFTTDLLGSVRSSTESSGSVKASYTYDAFGALLEGELSGASNYGYLGKQKDPTTKLYNYGYRDYKPATARFTTIDPIRDGSNWFTYCNGDPVNFVDLWGLEINNFSAYSSMSDFTQVRINNTNSKISEYGCAMTGMANIITEVMHKENPTQHVYNINTHEGTFNNITPLNLNISDFFYGNTDNLLWNVVAEKYGLNAKRSSSKSDAQDMIKSASNSKEQEYVLMQVKITIGEGKAKQDVLHWVGHSGHTITEKGTTWVEIVATSDNDSGRYKKNSNWMNKDGKIYVKQSAIEGAVVVTKKNK